MSEKLKCIEFVDHLDGSPRLAQRAATTGAGGWPEMWASFARTAARDGDSFVIDPEILARPDRAPGLSVRTGL